MRTLLLLAFVAATGCAPTYYVANIYDNGGTLMQEKCAISGVTGKPDPSDCHSEEVISSADSGSRYSQVEDAPVIPPVKLEPVAVDRAKYRNAAIELTRRGDAAAANNDCATAKSDADKVNEVDREYYTTVVLHDPALAKCALTSGT